MRDRSCDCDGDGRDPARWPCRFRRDQREQPVGRPSRHQPGQSRRPGPATRGRRRRCRRRAPRVVVTSEGAVWVGVNGAGIETAGWVARIDPATARVTTTIATGRGIHSLASTGSGAVGDESARRHRVGHRHRHLGAGGHVTDRRHARRARGRPRFGVAGSASRRRRAANRSGRGARSGGATRHRTRRRRELGHDLPALLRSPAARPSFSRPTGRTARRRGRSSRRACPATPACAPRTGSASPIAIEAGQAGPAATVAGDLHDALAEIGEHGPFVVVGRGLGGLYGSDVQRPLRRAGGRTRARQRLERRFQRPDPSAASRRRPRQVRAESYRRPRAAVRRRELGPSGGHRRLRRPAARRDRRPPRRPDHRIREQRSAAHGRRDRSARRPPPDDPTRSRPRCRPKVDSSARRTSATPPRSSSTRSERCSDDATTSAVSTRLAPRC